MRSKYNLSDLIRMLKEKNGGDAIYHPRCGFDGEKKTREWRGLDDAGGWGPAFPTAEPRFPAVEDPSPLPEIVNARDVMSAEPLDSPDQAVDPFPQPEIVKARDAIAVEPLDSPDGCEKRGRRSRIPSSDGAIVSGS